MVQHSVGQRWADSMWVFCKQVFPHRCSSAYFQSLREKKKKKKSLNSQHFSVPLLQVTQLNQCVHSSSVRVNEQPRCLVWTPAPTLSSLPR